MALDSIQQSLVLLAFAVREARSVLEEADLSAESRLAKLQRILGNDIIEVIVSGVGIATEAPQPQDRSGPTSERCPVCDGEKAIAGATCFRCKGSGFVQ